MEDTISLTHPRHIRLYVLFILFIILVIVFFVQQSRTIEDNKEDNGIPLEYQQVTLTPEQIEAKEALLSDPALRATVNLTPSQIKAKEEVLRGN